MSHSNMRNAIAHLDRKTRRMARAEKRTGRGTTWTRPSGVPLFMDIIRKAQAVSARAPLPKAFDDQTLAITR